MATEDTSSETFDALGQIRELGGALRESGQPIQAAQVQTIGLAARVVCETLTVIGMSVVESLGKLEQRGKLIEDAVTHLATVIDHHGARQ